MCRASRTPSVWAVSLSRRTPAPEAMVTPGTTNVEEKQHRSTVSTREIGSWQERRCASPVRPIYGPVAQLAGDGRDVDLLGSGHEPALKRIGIAGPALTTGRPVGAGRAPAFKREDRAVRVPPGLFGSEHPSHRSKGNEQRKGRSWCETGQGHMHEDEEDDEEVRCAICGSLAEHYFDGWHCEQGCF